MQVLLSIKPEYANRIFSGEKLFEFRKSIFKNKGVNEIYVYASFPIKKIVGKFSIKHIYCDTPNAIWNMSNAYGGIEKNAFFEYFKGKEKAYAIEIMDVIVFQSPLSPEAVMNDFVPPQSFRYLNQDTVQKLSLSCG